MDLYYASAGATSRAVLMTAKAVGVKLNLKPLNTRNGEHLTPEFLKINPQHTIPTIVDDGFSLWESRAIMVYLVEKYGKTDALFPKCPNKQALINQRLYFDMGTLYKSFSDYYYPLLTKKPVDPEKLKSVDTAFDLLNTFLEGQDYIAGDFLSIADIIIVATVTTFEAVGYDVSKYPNVAKWLANAPNVIPGWEENLAGIEAMKVYLKDL